MMMTVTNSQKKKAPQQEKKWKLKNKTKKKTKKATETEDKKKAEKKIRASSLFAWLARGIQQSSLLLLLLGLGSVVDRAFLFLSSMYSFLVVGVRLELHFLIFRHHRRRSLDLASKQFDKSPAGPGLGSWCCAPTMADNGV